MDQGSLSEMRIGCSESMIEYSDPLASMLTASIPLAVHLPQPMLLDYSQLCHETDACPIYFKLVKQSFQ